MRKLWLLIPVAILGILCYTSAQTNAPDKKVIQATHLVPDKHAPPTVRPAKLGQDAAPIHFSAELATRPDSKPLLFRSSLRSLGTRELVSRVNSSMQEDVL